jgi:hypothetical protein
VNRELFFRVYPYGKRAVGLEVSGEQLATGISAGESLRCGNCRSVAKARSKAESSALPGKALGSAVSNK